ncbi:hypothetical protein [Massilia oculi]|uniref:hypothetical protein n=1 Tax=Massilia oculi TaxID=945844 RepID=UPI001AAE4994|nr:hypothetical protein [Massilia oculi]
MAVETESITSIDQLAAALEADDSQDHQDPDNAQPNAEAQNDDTEGQPEQEGDQQQPVEGEGDQPAAPESLDDTVVSWETASGEKFEVPVAEMKLGYMREQDYRHKTQTFAQEREQTVQHIQQQYQVAETFAADLGHLHAVNAQIAALEQAIPTIDRNSDPAGYVDVVTHLQALREQRGGIAGRVQQAQEQQQAQQQQQFQQAQQRMLSDLQTSIPGFNQELLGKLSTTARDYGFTDQELGRITDPRFVRLVHDAMQHKTLQAKAPGAVNKVKAAPVKPAKQTSTATTTGVEINLKKFAKNKSLDNFAALLQHTL